MDLEMLFYSFILSLAVAYWAKVWHRNATGFLLLSFLLSPILGLIVLLYKGDKRKDEQKVIDDQVYDLVKEQFFSKYLSNVKGNSAAKDLFDKLTGKSKVDIAIIKTTMSFMK